jgi:hypothetical protein
VPKFREISWLSKGPVDEKSDNEERLEEALHCGTGCQALRILKTSNVLGITARLS